MDTSLIKILVGQVVRHLLTTFAALLAGYGVTADQATAFVNSTTAIVVAIVMALLAQLWAVLSKKKALDTPPT